MNIGNLTRREFGLAAGAFSVFAAFGKDAVERPVVRFGAFADSHYADKNPQTGGSVADSVYYRDSLAKVKSFVETMNSRKVDFVIELGDFKDDSGGAEATLARLDEIEGEFAKFDGPRYHVLGNHDTDVLTKDEFLSHVTNTGIGASRRYYSFRCGGVKFIVLDACYDSQMNPYCRNNPWTDSNIPPEEIDWLRGELKASSSPAIVFCHQRLDPNAAPNHDVRNAAEVRAILEASGRVHAVFTGHEHVEGTCNLNGIYYYSLKGLTVGPAPAYNAFVEVAVYRSGAASVTANANGQYRN